MSSAVGLLDLPQELLEVIFTRSPSTPLERFLAGLVSRSLLLSLQHLSLLTGRPHHNNNNTNNNESEGEIANKEWSRGSERFWLHAEMSGCDERFMEAFSVEYNLPLPDRLALRRFLDAIELGNVDMFMKLRSHRAVVLRVEVPSSWKTVEFTTSDLCVACGRSGSVAMLTALLEWLHQIDDSWKTASDYEKLHWPWTTSSSSSSSSSSPPSSSSSTLTSSPSTTSSSTLTISSTSSASPSSSSSSSSTSSSSSSSPSSSTLLNPKLMNWNSLMRGIGERGSLELLSYVAKPLRDFLMRDSAQANKVFPGIPFNRYIALCDGVFVNDDLPFFLHCQQLAPNHMESDKDVILRAFESGAISILKHLAKEAHCSVVALLDRAMASKSTQRYRGVALPIGEKALERWQAILNELPMEMHQSELIQAINKMQIERVDAILQGIPVQLSDVAIVEAVTMATPVELPPSASERMSSWQCSGSEARVTMQMRMMEVLLTRLPLLKARLLYAMAYKVTLGAFLLIRHLEEHPGDVLVHWQRSLRVYHNEPHDLVAIHRCFPSLWDFCIARFTLDERRALFISLLQYVPGPSPILSEPYFKDIFDPNLEWLLEMQGTLLVPDKRPLAHLFQVISRPHHHALVSLAFLQDLSILIEWLSAGADLSALSVPQFGQIAVRLALSGKAHHFDRYCRFAKDKAYGKVMSAIGADLKQREDYASVLLLFAQGFEVEGDTVSPLQLLTLCLRESWRLTSIRLDQLALIIEAFVSREAEVMRALSESDRLALVRAALRVNSIDGVKKMSDFYGEPLVRQIKEDLNNLMDSLGELGLLELLQRNIVLSSDLDLLALYRKLRLQDKPCDRLLELALGTVEALRRASEKDMRFLLVDLLHRRNMNLLKRAKAQIDAAQPSSERMEAVSELANQLLRDRSLALFTAAGFALPRGFNIGYQLAPIAPLWENERWSVDGFDVAAYIGAELEAAAAKEEEEDEEKASADNELVNYDDNYGDFEWFDGDGDDLGDDE